MGATTRKIVLIVDDDADIRETISFALEDEGYEVASAANGADALLAAIPVLVITASGNAKEQAKVLTVEGIIKKPIALHTLLETVRRSLHQP